MQPTARERVVVAPEDREVLRGCLPRLTQNLRIYGFRMKLLTVSSA